MNYMIYGEDCRHAIVSALLTDAGHMTQAPADLLILSPKESFREHTDVLKEHAFIWGGPASDTAALRAAGFRKVAQSDSFRVKNSVYTAEGALALAISETRTALCETSVAVLGYGYLGKECARLFAALSADITVYTENAEELARATLDGYRSLKLTALSTLDETLILNTIPFPVLDTIPILVTHTPTLLIELASIPCSTKEIEGLRVLPAGALPSRFSPYSAAKLMFDEINYQLEKE